MNYIQSRWSQLLIVMMSLLLCGVVQLFARPLREQEARELAEQFFQKSTQTQQLRSVELTLVSAPTCTTNGYEPQSMGEPARYYYVYNRGEGRGFVIVAGDDRFAPYIGYAVTGSFSIENIPDNLFAFLKACQQRMDELTTQVGWQSLLAPTLPREAEPTEVNPLLGDIMWDQSAPWNSKTPESKNGVHMPVGCVATAYSQVMRYYQWPDKGEGSFEYKEPETKRKHKVNFGTATYDWKHMPASYPDGRTPTAEEVEALGTLCYHAGVAIETTYAADGSGSFAPLIVRAMRNHFRYDKSVTFKRRINYTQPEWDKIIRKELAAKRPVIYSGTGTGGGHAFVCDGYNAEGFYHINWGWSGLANGYFNLNFLAPGYLGIGGGAGGGFSMEQGIVVGITPDRAGNSKVTEEPLVTTRKFTMTLVGGETIKLRDAQYAIWLSDGTFEYDGNITYAATKLGSTDTIYMDQFAKYKYLSSLYDLVTNFDVLLDVTNILSEGTWNFFLAYQVELPNGKKAWRPCAMDVREGRNENGKGRHTYTIKKKSSLTWSVAEDLSHPFSQVELVDGSVQSSFESYEKSSVTLKLKNTGRGEFFRQVFLEIKSEGGDWRAYTDVLPAIQVGETQEVTFKADRCPYAKGKLSLRISYQTEDFGKMQYFELPDATVQAASSIRPAFTIAPADEGKQMEANTGTGELSKVRVRYVGTTLPQHEVRCRYILEYGLEKVWTDLMPISVATQGEVVLTPQLMELLKKLGVIGGETIKLTMSFFEVETNGTKHRLPTLGDPAIEVYCKKGAPVQKFYPVTKEVEGDGELTITGFNDLSAVPSGTKLTVTAKPAEGYQLVALTANGQDILVSKSFTVTSETRVKGVFSKAGTYTVTLTSNEYGTISIAEDVDLKAVPSGTKLTVQVRAKNDQCELKTLTANGEDILATKSFTVTTDTEVKAFFIDHSGVSSIGTSVVRLYPNPANDYLLLESISVGVHVALYTLEGELVLDIKAETTPLRMDLSQIQEGNYILQIGRETHRLIVTR